MKSAVLFNGIGGIVIIASVILHIVCIATPHFSGIQLDLDAKTLAGMANSFSESSADPDVLGDDDSLSQMSETMTFGLWKMCVSSVASMDASVCLVWGKKSSIMGTNIAITIGDWIHGVQAMAIIGTLLAGIGAILAVVNMIIESKGDRQRYLYLIISACCISGGIAMLIGDIIMSAKYKTVIQDIIKGMPIPDNIDVPEMIVKMLEDKMYLSWGFALDIVSSAMALLSGIVIIVGGRMAMDSNGVV